MATLDQYLGNPNLKKAHTKSRFTKKQVEEYINILMKRSCFYSNNQRVQEVLCTISKRLGEGS